MKPPIPYMRLYPPCTPHSMYRHWLVACFRNPPLFFAHFQKVLDPPLPFLSLCDAPYLAELTSTHQNKSLKEKLH